MESDYDAQSHLKRFWIRRFANWICWIFWNFRVWTWPWVSWTPVTPTTAWFSKRWKSAKRQTRDHFWWRLLFPTVFKSNDYCRIEGCFEIFLSQGWAFDVLKFFFSKFLSLLEKIRKTTIISFDIFWCWKIQKFIKVQNLKSLVYTISKDGSTKFTNLRLLSATSASTIMFW